MDLDKLIGDFKSKQGTMPQVNPPAAAKVLETQTKPEVAGQPEPVKSVAPRPTSTGTGAAAPDASSAGSANVAVGEPVAEGKPRRTAAVVQAELDQVAAELAQTKAALEKERGAAIGAGEAAAGALIAAKTELDAVKAELAKAVEFAQSVVADNARLSEVEPTIAGKRSEDWTVESAADFLKTRGFGIFTLGAS